MPKWLAALVQEGFVASRKVAALVQHGFVASRKVAAVVRQGFVASRVVDAVVRQGFGVVGGVNGKWLSILFDFCVCKKEIEFNNWLYINYLWH